MTVNSLIGGSSTLQNELLKLLSGTEETKTTETTNTTENENNEMHNEYKKAKESKKIKKSKQDKENVELENIIKDSINKQNIEDAKYVNSDMTGGTNIVGLVENILAGGNLNNSNESEIKDTTNNAMMSGEDIIGNILIEGGNDKSKSKNIDLDSELNKLNDDSEYDKLSESYEASDNASANASDDESDTDVDNKYIKIINELKMFNESNDSISLTGGNSQHVQHVKVLNMFPWILKS